MDTQRAYNTCYFISLSSDNNRQLKKNPNQEFVVNKNMLYFITTYAIVLLDLDKDSKQQAENY